MKILQFLSCGQIYDMQDMAEIEKECRIPCSVPPCGNGIYISGSTFLFIYLNYSAVYRKTCEYVGMSGRSSPQCRATGQDDIITLKQTERDIINTNI